MLIGIIHSYYRSKLVSGENLVVDELSQMLIENGFQTSQWSSFSDKVTRDLKSKFQGLARVTIRDPMNGEFKKWLTSIDSIQIHNSFPALSNDNINSIYDSSIEIVKVIHNHRMTCLNGLHFRNGNTCHSCLGKAGLAPSVLHGCYGGSSFNSLVMAGFSKMTQEKLEKRINRYVAVSPYIQDYLIQLGVLEKQITVIPNAVKPRAQIANSASEVIFSGRLEASKGAKLVLDLWRVNRTLPAINVIGSGDLLEDFKEASSKDKRIIVHGALSQDELEKVAFNCSVALVPSLTAESFGRSAVEALARGQSLVTTRIGALQSLVSEGVAFGFNEASLDDFNRAVEEALESHSLFTSARCIDFWNMHFSPTKISKDWINFYSQKSQEGS